MAKEIWKPILGWPYEVSNMGKVKNANNGNTVKPWRQKSGYLNADLHLNGVKKSYRVHRLVAEAFIPNPDGKTEVNHIDGNKENNAVDNLEWATHKENMGHAFDNGLCQISDSHLQELKEKLSDPEVRKKASESRKRAVIRSDGEIFDSVKSAAESCGVKPSTISSHLHGRVKSVKGFTFEWIDRLTALIERGA